MRFGFVFITCFFMHLFPATLNGKDIDDVLKKIHQVWSDKQGLPQNSITNIAEDSRGWLWITTLDGISFYNGIGLQTLNLPLRNASNAVSRNALVCSGDGSIWIGTTAGWLHKLMPQKDAKPKDWLWQNYDLTKHSETKQIYALAQQTEDRLLIGTDSGLIVFDGQRFSKAYGAIDLNDPKLKRPIFSILQASSGTLYCGSSAQVITIDSSTFSIIAVPGKSEAKIFSILESQLHGIIIGSQGDGLFKLQQSTVTSLNANFTLQSRYITCLANGKDNRIYVGTNKGISILSKQSVEMISEAEGLSNQVVLSFYEHSSSQLFIGTEVGLSIMHPQSFKTLSPSEGVIHPVIWAIAQDSRGNYYFGTTAGLSVFNAKSGNFTSYLSGFTIRDIEPLNNKTMLLATNNGIYQFKAGKPAPFHPDQFEKLTVTDIATHPNGNLYIGTTDQGLLIWDYRTLKTYTTISNFPSNYIYTILHAPNRSTYVGTRGGGLVILEENEIKIIDSQNGLINNDVRSLLQDDRHSALWIGTNGGLSRWQNGNFEHLHLKTTPALPNNVIYQLQIDRSGHLYGLTNRGVFRLSNLHKSENSLQVQIQTYTTDDGLPSMEGNAGASYVDSKGQLWFGTVKGAAMLNPVEQRLKDDQHHTLLNSILIHENLDSLQRKKLISSSERNPLLLRYNQNHLTFEFACLTFKREHETQFQTRLIGFDKEPSGWLNQTQKEYTNLPAGSYAFHIQAKDYDGKLAQPIAFHFKIEAAPWKTPLAYLVYAIVLGLSGYGLNRLNVKRLKQRQLELEALVKQRTTEVEAQKNALERSNKELKELNELKSQFLNIASHDLKNPLQTILGYAQLIKEDAENQATVSRMSDAIYRSSQNMVGLIKDLLDTSAIESGRLDLNKTTFELGGLVSMVCNEFQQHLEKKQQILSLDLESNCYIQADAHRMREIVENLLSNAIKYSPVGKTINVSLKKSPKKNSESIRFSVSDEGLGLTEDDLKKLFGKFQKLSARPTGGESSTGLGLSIVKQLVELHRGRVWAESPGKNRGSTFFIELPAQSTPS